MFLLYYAVVVCFVVSAMPANVFVHTKMSKLCQLPRRHDSFCKAKP